MAHHTEARFDLCLICGDTKLGYRLLPGTCWHQGARVRFLQMMRHCHSCGDLFPATENWRDAMDAVLRNRESRQ
jgi:hypothetical protein